MVAPAEIDLFAPVLTASLSKGVVKWSSNSGLLSHISRICHTLIKPLNSFGL